jgi:hypothetical protein
MTRARKRCDRCWWSLGRKLGGRLGGKSRQLQEALPRPYALRCEGGYGEFQDQNQLENRFPPDEIAQAGPRVPGYRRGAGKGHPAVCRRTP